MRITWVTRSFLDYRIPVYAELNRLCGKQLTVIYYADVVPERTQKKLRAALKERAIGLTGEWRFSGKKNNPLSNLHGGGIRIPWQPGLLKACKESVPEVMLGDGFFQWSYAPLILRMLYHIPYVMCYEPTMHTERNTSFFRTFYRKTVTRWIDAICCNGQLCKEYTLTLGVTPEKIYLGNMVADSETLSQNCQHLKEIELDEFKRKYLLVSPVFLYVGRLVELKGVLPLLQAWAKLRPQASLLLAGNGPERKTLEDFCRSNNLSNVFFAGAIDYDQLAIYYRCADVFIIPTLQDNWSLVVPEAMACGLPVACSKYNECYPELVKPENGWVFDPLDQDETVRMLQDIVAKKNALPQMGEASRHIAAEHTPQHAANVIFTACKSVFMNNHR